MSESLTIPQALEVALQHHQSGRLSEAEALCRKVVAAVPGLGDGWHLLGVVVCQSGRLDEGVGHLRRAISLQPGNPSFRTNLGVFLFKHQQVEEAEACYRESLRLKPDQPVVWGYLGNALLARQRWQEAESAYLSALKQNPRQPAVWCHLARARQALNQWDEAEANLREAIRIKPEMASAHSGLGGLLQKRGRYEEAEHALREAIRHDPGLADPHNQLGLVLESLGRDDDAVAHFREAIRLSSSSPGAACNLSNTLRRRGDPAGAEAVCRQALGLHPDFAELHHALGIALADQDRLPEAEAAYRLAIQNKPDFAESHVNLGAVLEKRERLAEAEAVCRKGIELNPGRCEAHHNLAVVLKSLGSLVEAESASRKSLELDPEYAEAHNLLRGILWDMGRRDEARASALATLKYRPDHPDAHLGLAMDHLIHGDFERGGPEYEWRWKCREFGAPLPVDVRSARPLWNGSPLAGKRLLLYSEQGLGDVIQFSRYVPLVREIAGEGVRFASHLPVAIPLLRTMDGIGEVFPGRALLPEFDEQISLMSLPGLLGTRLETIPAPGPYLRADPHWRELVEERLGERKGYRIGINWQGNMRNRQLRHRSIPLPEWKALGRVDGVEWFSLQHGDGSEQLRSFDGFAITDLGHLLDRLAEEQPGDTDENRLLLAAAAIDRMDLVITIDTMAAHLAGALGKPAWVLLSLSADWRWLLEREDSPWYPSLRLFRQTTLHRWNDVMEAVAAELEKRVRNS